MNPANKRQELLNLLDRSVREIPLWLGPVERYRVVDNMVRIALPELAKSPPVGRCLKLFIRALLAPGGRQFAALELVDLMSSEQVQITQQHHPRQLGNPEIESDLGTVVWLPRVVHDVALKGS